MLQPKTSCFTALVWRFNMSILSHQDAALEKKGLLYKPQNGFKNY